MELLRNYTETDLHSPRKSEDIIALHKHLAEMDLRFATGTKKAELEIEICRLNNTKNCGGDMFKVLIPYSGSEPLFFDISTAEEVARMLSEVDRREKGRKRADIRTVIIETSPQPERFIRKVLNFISGGYYY